MFQVPAPIFFLIPLSYHTPPNNHAIPQLYFLVHHSIQKRLSQGRSRGREQVVPPPRATASKGLQNWQEYILKKTFHSLRLTNIKLLIQKQPNSTNNFNIFKVQEATILITGPGRHSPSTPLFAADRFHVQMQR